MIRCPHEQLEAIVSESNTNRRTTSVEVGKSFFRMLESEYAPYWMDRETPFLLIVGDAERYQSDLLADT